MSDNTESIRRVMVQEINHNPVSREALEARHGKVWDTEEMARDFDGLSFAAPFMIVAEKSTGKKGSLMFQDRPRFYFSFEAHDG